jgi:hypothetical protein
MWALLREPGHEASFADHGEGIRPMRHVVGFLAKRPYSHEVSAFKTMASFCITIAPTYQESCGHDVVRIGYNPEGGLFSVSYSEWISSTRNPPHRTTASRSCEPSEVIDVIDRYVLRLLLTEQAR